jgi:hypothetical protein
MRRASSNLEARHQLIPDLLLHNLAATILNSVPSMKYGVRMFRTLFCSCVVLTIIFQHTSLATPLNVKVVAGGQAFQGPPEFRVIANGATAGSIRVDNALNSTQLKEVLRGGGVSLESVKANLKEYAFSVPQLQTTATIAVEFANDAWGGSGTSDDRNLWISEIIINGVTYGVDELQLDPEVGFKSAGIAVLLRNGRLVVKKPKEGWLKTTGSAKVDCGELEEMFISGYAARAFKVPSVELQKITEFAAGAARNGCSVVVTGEATPGGTKTANERIARARADAVKILMINAGVESVVVRTKLGSNRRGVTVSVD